MYFDAFGVGDFFRTPPDYHSWLIKADRLFSLQTHDCIEVFLQWPPNPLGKLLWFIFVHTKLVQLTISGNIVLKSLIADWNSIELDIFACVVLILQPKVFQFFCNLKKSEKKIQNIFMQYPSLRLRLFRKGFFMWSGKTFRKFIFKQRKTLWKWKFCERRQKCVWREVFV